jgi:energy-coupling factor transporter ATP-binding protein EcfA2
MKPKNNDFLELMEAYTSEVYYAKDGDTQNDQEKSKQEIEAESDDFLDSVEKEISKLNQDRKQKKQDSIDVEEIELDPDLASINIDSIRSENPAFGEKDVWNHKDLLIAINEQYLESQPILVYGDTGIGKSTVFKEWAINMADEMGRIFVSQKDIGDTFDKLMVQIVKNPKLIERYFFFIDIRAVRLNPEDLMGIIDIASKEPFLETKDFQWLWLATQENAAGLLFLDEMNQASLGMLASLYEPVLDHSVKNKAISKEIMIGAAVNEGFKGTNKITQGLMSRFRNGILVLDPPVWLEHAKKMGLDTRIVGFLEDDNIGGNLRQKLGMLDPKGETYQRMEDKTYPTPRTIFNFDTLFKRILREYDNIVKKGIIDKSSGFYDIYNNFVQRYGEDFLNNDGYKKQFKQQALERFKNRVKNAAGTTLGRLWGKNFILYIFEDLKFNMEKMVKAARSKSLKKVLTVSGDYHRLVNKTIGHLKTANYAFKQNNNQLNLEVSTKLEDVMYILSNLEEGDEEVMGRFLSDLTTYFSGTNADFKYAFLNEASKGNYDPELKEKVKNNIKSAGSLVSKSQTSASSDEEARKASGV